MTRAERRRRRSVTAGETALNPMPIKTKTAAERIKRATRVRERLSCGHYSIVRCLDPDKLWITDRRTGEAMQTDDLKLARHIGVFWRREF